MSVGITYSSFYVGCSRKISGKGGYDFRESLSHKILELRTTGRHALISGAGGGVLAALLFPAVPDGPDDGQEEAVSPDRGAV